MRAITGACALLAVTLLTGCTAMKESTPIRDEAVKKGPYVLAVADTGTDFVLAPQTIAAVQRDSRKEPRLPQREAERFERLSALGKGRHRPSR